MIVYFYEKLSDGLYTYQAPAPTPSRLNIPYFVSNGYLVFAPDISYETGYPGKSATDMDTRDTGMADTDMAAMDTVDTATVDTDIPTI